MHILCVFIYTFEEKIPQKGAYPLQIQILNDCIYTCWVNRNQLLGDIITQISREYGLEINSEKSCVMIFNVREQPEHLCNIKVVQKMKYLGI